MFKVSDIRNKLGPIKKFIAMVEDLQLVETLHTDLQTILLREIVSIKKSIKYLSNED